MHALARPFLLLLTLVVAILIALFFQTRAINSVDHTHRLDQFLQLRELDAALDEQTLLIATGVQHQYDTQVNYRRQHDQLMNQLLNTDSAFNQGLNQHSAELLQSYYQDQQRKYALSEEIKHYAALIRNALLYMPTLVQELRDLDHPQRDEAARLMSQLFRYHLFPDQKRLTELNQATEQLQHIILDDHPALLSFANQASSNLRHLESLHKYRDEFNQIDTSHQLRALEQSYQKHYNQRSRHAEAFTLTLLLLSCLLMLLLGGMFRRLQQLNYRSEQARTRLQDAVNSLSEAFALFDKHGKLVLYNQRWLAFYPWLQRRNAEDWSTLQSINKAQGVTTSSPIAVPLDSTQNYLEHTPDGSWYQASNNPTAEGGIASVRTNITETQQAHLKLRQLGRALEQSPSAVMITDTQGIIEYINPKLSEMTGYTSDELLGQNNNILKSGKIPADIFTQMWQQLRDGNTWTGQLLNRKKDGTLFWDSTSISPLRTDEGEISHFIAVKEDITERLRAEEQLRMVAAVFETSNEAIMVADHQGTIKVVNAAFERITGYTTDEVKGQNPSLLSSGRHDRLFYDAMWNSLHSEGCWSGEIWNRRKDGSVYPEWLSISALHDDEGQITEFVSVFSDITSRKEAEAHIRHQAYYDALTQLPNRSLLLDRLEVAISTAERDQQTISVLFIDLDRFKYVNDTLGHEYGDELLVEAATRLAGCVRESDTVARFGGDEFVVLLHNIHSDRDAALVAEKIIRQLSEPFALAGRDIIIGASIGLAMYPGESDDPDTLLRNADLAMYRAKQTGRNRFQFFTSSLQEHANTLMEMEQDLRLALENGQLEIYYQPLVRAQSGRVTGVEALLRWHHPTLGMVSPDQFIPLAEDTGLIGPIGQWVLETACQQVSQWQQQGLKLYLSVNISGRQRDLGMDAPLLRRILMQAKLPAEQLVLEITEGMLLDNSDETIAWLQSFCDLGVHLAIDDFGTGYSALSYLKRFPIDTLKIDQGFVRDLTLDNEDALLVEAIISMARSLKLRLIAEGVETEEQRHVLFSLGCEFLQGYYFAKPMPATSLVTWMANYQPIRLG
ncbi:EAL domain-containing protein [Nitrincola sp.]|uniref:EAL domain-containing protein n=1 Tax=Nitrincola sp. TaxID=1926584 RepID=UPI003A8CC246